MMAQRRVTDRAERYRAQKNVTGPRKCVLCGATRNLDVMHLDGNESHGEPANLAYGCRSCNGKLAAAFKRAGAGRPTNQYNPATGGVPTFQQYMWAVSNHSRGEHDAGGAVIHATPKSKRIEYARRISAQQQRTKRDRFEERYNPAFAVLRGGKVVFKSDDRFEASQHATDLKRAHPKEKIGFAERQSKTNPWPFSRPDARRTTPASGGIAYHTRRKRADDLNTEFLKSKRPAKGKAAKSAGASAMPDEEALQAGFKRGLSLADMLRSNPGLRKRQKANPGAFARFVKRCKVNPAAASAEVFEDFHGFPSSEVVTVSKKVHHHAHLAALGTLTQLDVWGVDGIGHKISGFKDALLACNEMRDQLFVEGGDQRINLEDFGIRKPHETETLGRVTNIGYRTNKTHLGDEGGDAVYVHRFRGINKAGKHVVVKMAREPDLIYDVRNEQLLFSGGSYEILREGINQ